jgi:hypothetical protein
MAECGAGRPSAGGYLPPDRPEYSGQVQSTGVQHG